MDKEITLNKERVSIIVALSKKNRAIGLNNQLLWRIPGDLPRFKSLTMGHPIIMGRKTFESIGKILPGRTNIILSTNPTFRALGAHVFTNLDDALTYAKSEKTGEVFIIGGAQIYEKALLSTDRLYVTEVLEEPEADTFFPPYENDFVNIISTENHEDISPAHLFTIRERAPAKA